MKHHRQHQQQNIKLFIPKKITASFYCSFNERQKLPSSNIPYIAFAGRTNCGKSSLLNSLTGNKKLARSSSTPGRTQLVNFFSINGKLFFVDLPGYGFSKASLEVRNNISKTTNDFLLKCKDRLIIVFLLDIRVEPSEEDFQMKEWAKYHNVPLIFVFTKSDKLSSNKLINRKKRLIEALSIADEEVVMYSSKTGRGKDELLRKINQKISEFFTTDKPFP
ncbi:MAG: YihA family ribosome biogenesis GTP-binding protein [Candidatus Schekmanbacteria bacterium]|nr:MAG: YihA family ribosome biogenesis GTP-binding protein [Candidatus Schekmanbacteria bacterium]